MSRSSGTVFEGKRYWSPTGVRATTPPDDIPDVSGKGNDGTFTNASYTQLPSGLWVMEFDGTGDYVTIADAPSLNLRIHVSLSIWIYVEEWAWAHAFTVAGILDKGTLTSGVGYSLRATDTTQKLSFTISGDGGTQTCTSASMLAAKTWYYIAATFDGSNLRLYENAGTPVTTNLADTIKDSSGVDLIIGAGESLNREFYGKIGPPDIMNYVLSQDNINTIYAREKGWFEL